MSHRLKSSNTSTMHAINDADLDSQLINLQGRPSPRGHHIEKAFTTSLQKWATLIDAMGNLKGLDHMAQPDSQAVSGKHSPICLYTSNLCELHEWK